jgi:hypothetical protein
MQYDGGREMRYRADDFMEAERIVKDVFQRMRLVADDGDRYRLQTHIQVHINSCKQLQGRHRLYRQLFNAFNDALDDSSHSPPPSLPQHEVWLHLRT